MAPPRSPTWSPSSRSRGRFGSWCLPPSSMTTLGGARAACLPRTMPSSMAATHTITMTFVARRRSASAASHYVDVGTSGGVWGFERGYCQMIGGEPAVVKRLDGIFAALAPGASITRPRARSKSGRHRRRGLHPLRAARRRTLRQDGSQWDRVRRHGGVRRGAQHSPPRQRREGGARRPMPRPPRCVTPSSINTT